jgi:hypothetical protein
VDQAVETRYLPDEKRIYAADGRAVGLGIRFPLGLLPHRRRKEGASIWAPFGELAHDIPQMQYARVTLHNAMGPGGRRENGPFARLGIWEM